VRGHGGTAGRPSTLSRTHRPPCWCVRCWARSLSSRRRPLWPSLQRRGGASAWRLARRSRAQEPRRDAPGRCGAGKAARPQETEGRGVEPAGDLGIAGRATPPQRARQAVQSKVGRGDARGASAVANWEEPYGPRAKASSRPLSSITGSCSASLTRWSPSIPNAKPHGQRSRSMRSR
jgi:hypothetical protein